MGFLSQAKNLLWSIGSQFLRQTFRHSTCGRRRAESITAFCGRRHFAKRSQLSDGVKARNFSPEAIPLQQMARREKPHIVDRQSKWSRNECQIGRAHV